MAPYLDGTAQIDIKLFYVKENIRKTPVKIHFIKYLMTNIRIFKCIKIKESVRAREIAWR